MARKDSVTAWSDVDFTSETTAAELKGPHPYSKALLYVIAAFFVSFLVWASLATLDEVTHAEGRVIPSSQVQVLQNLEGGILERVLVSEGETVEKGQVMLRIDNSSAASDLGEMNSRYYSLMGEIARLEAEAEGKPLDFPPELTAEHREIALQQRELYDARQEELQTQLSILRQQADQRRSELTELRGKLTQLSENLSLARDELRLTEPLVEKRVVPQVNLLRLKREVSDIQGEISATRLAIPRAEASIEEANKRIEERFLKFRSEALRELNVKRAELESVRQSITAAQDRVLRTEVRSPVTGIVKEIMVTTLGGVIKPGQDLVAIVPLEDTLLVEARVRPQDIAFLRPGQEANVKFSAYDFSVYGGLAAKLERISADTIIDEKGEAFYKAVVRTEQNYLRRGNEQLPIIPGMVATVDVLTGEKTVLEYLFKPIVRASEVAMTER